MCFSAAPTHLEKSRLYHMPNRLLLQLSYTIIVEGPFSLRFCSYLLSEKLLVCLRLFAMQLLLLIFLVAAQVLRSNAQCIIMPIPPTAENGLTPCSWGSLTAGCQCCHNQIACQSLLQECTLGQGDNYICVNNPQYTSSCASEGFANCGTGCMPSTATCCPGQTGWCQAGYYCGTESCLPDDSDIPVSSSPSKATVPAPTPSTVKTTATSPTTTMVVLIPSTIKTTPTSPTTTKAVLSPSTSKEIISSTDMVPILSSSTKKNTAYTSTSPNLSPSSSSVATRKRCSGVSILVTMVIMNVFGFRWL